jgi:hypothetical protein
VHEQVLDLIPEVDETEPSVGVEPSDSSLGHLRLLISTDIAVVQCP